MIRPRLARLDWWLTGLCTARTFSGLVFMTYAAALPILQKQWAMSASAAGSISSGFHLGYAVTLIFCSYFSDIWGAKRIYLASMLSGAVFSLAFAFLARDYWSGLVLYTLVGISMGGTYTTGLMLLAEHYPVRRRGMAIGFFIASTSLSYTLSLLISGMALPVGGYKLSFMLTCLGPVLGVILGWTTLRKTNVSIVKRRKQQRFTKEVLGNRPAILLIGSYTFHSWELLAMWSWTPAFLTNCLLMGGADDLKAAGLGSYINALFHVTGFLACFSMGILSDRLGRARVILMAAGLSALCSFLFGWSIGWPFALVVGLGMLYAFSVLGDSPVLSAALTEVVETSYLGAAYGLRSLLGFGAGALSTLVFGAILDWTNPEAAGGQYATWGWAYCNLGVAGVFAVLTARQFGKIENKKA